MAVPMYPKALVIDFMKKAYEAGIHADVHTDNSKVIAELEEKLANADYQLEGRDLKIKELEQQCGEWKAKCNEWEERYFDLQQSKAREAQELRGLLLQEQQLRMSVEKKGFFKRLFPGKQENQ